MLFSTQVPFALAQVIVAQFLPQSFYTAGRSCAMLMAAQKSPATRTVVEIKIKITPKVAARCDSTKVAELFMNVDGKFISPLEAQMFGVCLGIGLRVCLHIAY